MASNGEPGLLEIPGLNTRGFPDVNGNGSGAPASAEGIGSVAALAQLEWQRAEGAEYLVLPEVTREWWGSLPEFHSHVNRHYPWTAVSDRAAIALLQAGFDGGRSWQTRVDVLLQDHQARFRGQPSILDLTQGLELAASFPEHTVIHPVDGGDALPYLEDSIDVVIVGEDASDARLGEARRVARNALIRMGHGLESDWEGAEWLREPDRRLPTVSIVIPTYDGAGHLETCLQAVKHTVPAHLEVEVLVIDDGSRDSTQQLLSDWSQRDGSLRYVRNDANLGFIESCNLGASRAEGDVLAFLNNDTIPVNGWLQALVETLSDRGDAGAVGGMLVYPDGTLQEAGGVIFSDASGSKLRQGRQPRLSAVPVRQAGRLLLRRSAGDGEAGLRGAGALRHRVPTRVLRGCRLLLPTPRSRLQRLLPAEVGGHTHRGRNCRDGSVARAEAPSGREPRDISRAMGDRSLTPASSAGRPRPDHLVEARSPSPSPLGGLTRAAKHSATGQRLFDLDVTGPGMGPDQRARGRAGSSGG